MEDYVEIKVKDLKEGQRFWSYCFNVGREDVVKVVSLGRHIESSSGRNVTVSLGSSTTVYAKSIINTGDTMEDLKAELAELNSKRKQSNADIEALQLNRNLLDIEHAALKKQIAEESKPKLMRNGDYSLRINGEFLHIMLGGKIFNQYGKESPTGYDPVIDVKVGLQGNYTGRNSRFFYDVQEVNMEKCFVQ